jgi:hypothetical protein
MAKKTVATLRTGQGRDFTKVIRMVKNPATDSYQFREDIIHKDSVNDFLKK